MSLEIRVCTVERDGRLRVWDYPDSVGIRAFVRSQQFPTYGAALDYAADFEAREHADALKRTSR